VFNAKTGSLERIEIYNGELGFVKARGFDKDKLKWQNGFRLKRFQVLFSRKENYWVGYGSDLGKTPKGKKLPKESPGENLELAYAISVHQAQGSEFKRAYFVIPKNKKTLLSRELFYTGITRAIHNAEIICAYGVHPSTSSG